MAQNEIREAIGTLELYSRHEAENLRTPNKTANIALAALKTIEWIFIMYPDAINLANKFQEFKENE